MTSVKVLRKKRAKWCPEEVEVLLQLWSERLLLLRGTKKNYYVHGDIAVQLSRRGFHYSGEEVKVKIHNLTNKYRDEKRASASVGSPSSWKHYDKMNSILGGYKSFNLNNEESTNQSLRFLKDQMKSKTQNVEPMEEQFIGEPDETLDETTTSCTDNSNVVEEFEATSELPTRMAIKPSPNNRSQVELEDFELTGEVPTGKRFKPRPNNRSQMLAMQHGNFQLLDKRASNKCFRDDDEAFFCSLLPFMKKMNMAEKMRCRIDIQHTVYNYAFSTEEKSSCSNATNRQYRKVSSPPNSIYAEKTDTNSIPHEDIKIEEFSNCEIDPVQLTNCPDVNV